jgi:hypothetical protein
VHCRARLDHNTLSLQSTAASREDHKNKKIEHLSWSKEKIEHLVEKKIKNRNHLPLPLQSTSEDPSVVASSLTPARVTPNVSDPSRWGEKLD